MESERDASDIEIVEDSGSEYVVSSGSAMETDDELESNEKLEKNRGVPSKPCYRKGTENVECDLVYDSYSESDSVFHYR